MLQERVRQLGEGVVFTVALSSVSGEPIQESRGKLTRESARQYAPRPGAREKAEKALASKGFKILHSGRYGITVRGPADLVADVLSAKLSVFTQAERTPARSVAVFASGTEPPEPASLFLAPQGSLSQAISSLKGIDHFVFIPPPLLFGPVAAAPPGLPYPHLGHSDIRRVLGASTSSERGTGVKAAIVDTGFYPHPYFASGGFSVTRVATQEALPADTDGVGHGTAVSLNLLEMAPGVDLLCVKTQAAQGAALEMAVDQGAKVVSCSWGWNYEQEFPTLAATIHALIEEGVVILFASGNGHYAWPGSMPDVLSIGGAFADPANKFAIEASNYASGYQSSRYPGRLVPDVAGLCGMIPRGVYIPMPCQPGCSMDLDYGKAPYPLGDGTGTSDGWVVASGTSSATPQVAGVVCLMLERAAKKGVSLTPALVKDYLSRSARLVTTGRNAFGFPATGAPGPNVACGFGLVDADAAINLV
jgi:subtilase family serine protease